MPTPQQVAAAEDIATQARRENRDLTIDEWQRYDALMRGLTTEPTEASRANHRN